MTGTKTDSYHEEYRHVFHDTLENILDRIRAWAFSGSRHAVAASCYYTMIQAKQQDTPKPAGVQGYGFADAVLDATQYACDTILIGVDVVTATFESVDGWDPKARETADELVKLIRNIPRPPAYI